MTRRTIAVDARTVFDETRRGIGKTTIALYRALAVARPDWRFLLFHRHPATDVPFEGCPNVELRRIDMPGDRFDTWPRIRLPAATLFSRADLFHTPSGLAPRFPVAPMVATIHDLIPLDTRGNELGVAAWGANVIRAARKAKAVFTPSEHAKGRIVDLCKIPAEKVAVVPWGPITTTGTPPTAELRKQYGVLDQPYVLHFGMADPRKNTARVIDAWAGLPVEVRGRFVLLVVGVQGPALEKFTQQCQALGVASSIRVTGYAPEDDVRSLLAGATALCYPTQYEGFGMPILDALAAGVPVLTSPTTSLPEVAGDCAVYVDPVHTVSITAGLQKLLTERDLHTRLVQMGRERAARFNWRDTAERVAELFHRVAEGSS